MGGACKRWAARAMSFGSFLRPICRVLSGRQPQLQDSDERRALEQPAEDRAEGNQHDHQAAQAELDTTKAELRCVTWNIAAINNNPFEYYVTLDDGMGYKELMEAVQDFIDAPGPRDVKVGQVFTPAMFAKLQEAMVAQGWTGVDKVVSLWLMDFSNRSIISGFIKDKEIGSKRLASMPDRFTNTINCADGGIFCRPTVINNYAVEMPDLDAWFDQWFEFFFQTEVPVKNKHGEPETKKVCALLQPIKRAKYPAVTEEEEAISIPLQVLALAIFDAILVHIMNSSTNARPEAPISWHDIKMKLCGALVVNKQSNVISVLAEHAAYFDADIIFLQEVAGAFVEAFEQDDQLRNRFLLLAPKRIDYVRDQNSLILVAKDRLPPDTDAATCEEVDIGNALDSNTPVVDGDVCAFVVPLLFAGKAVKKTILASFHGDTAGLASTPVVAALREAAASRSLPLVFGLDANTHGLADPKGSTKHVDSFLADLQDGQEPLGHCWGGEDKRKWTTTCNARTYLQPQLNKAVPYAERLSSKLTDCNPKDFVLFSSSDFEVVVHAARDNTGRGVFVEGMDFPSLSFPSDHAVVSATIRKRKRED
uniref:Endonuclease/exonuclease/phosphatase domain-containing protein n=1 Tax=Pyrodinium bahamense TaxID=73915 RepID=A0A7S0FVC0_9DINO